MVHVVAPGFDLSVFDGRVANFRPIRVEDPDGRQVGGFEARMHLVTRWRSDLRGDERALVTVLGVLDLILRWPAPATQVKLFRSGVARPQTTVHFESLTPYEVGALLAPRTPAKHNRLG
jgi:hypothetical protein